MKKIEVVCGVIFDDSNRILITQRGDKSNYQRWEFPGGKVKQGETNRFALKREIFEELSIKVEILEILYIEILEINDKIYNLNFYKGKYIEGSINLSVHLNYKWVKKNDLQKFDFLKGDIEMVKILTT